MVQRMANDPTWSSAAEPGRRLGRAVEFHASIGSTNDRAWDQLRAGVEGMAIVADLQTAGRGRLGRAWSSPPGVNLMVSLGIRPRLDAANAWRLGAATALAVREACRAALPSPADDDVWLKWPNDIVDGSGRKLAGLLLETNISGDRVTEAVIGVGMNVNWPRAEMPAEIRQRATSLLDLGDGELDRVDLLRTYLSALTEEVVAVEAGESPLSRYQAASWLTGRQVRVAVGEANVAGRVHGYGEDGSLELETDEGLVRIAYGEVVQVGVDEAAVPV
jgi:BirA family biotin operon repressor/biotin-[acetyl-CoA-carboxylase] ligase